jgi:hypothetical protein
MTGGRCNNGEAVTVSVVQQMLWYAVLEVEIADSSDVKKSSGRRDSSGPITWRRILF